ncbi:MAG: hypothetical protein KDD58_07060 [Bdellovibrionales bacterium]|nr:hypothetical protein [Bdellovibrionales bacterium]
MKNIFIGRWPNISLLFLVTFLISCSNGVPEFFELPSSVNNRISVLTFTPEFYDFGVVSTSSSPASQTISITNSGKVDATDIEVKNLKQPFQFIGDNFSASGTCGKTLKAGESCEVKVEFLPLNPGSYFEGLNLSYNDGKETQSFTIKLSGQGESDSPSTPTLILTDSDAIAAGYTNQRLTDVSIVNDSSAVQWCLSETQVTAPINGSASCIGGTGPLNGWYTVKPTTFGVSVSEGSKTVYLWIADDTGDVNTNISSFSIIYDTSSPATPNVEGVQGGADIINDDFLENGDIATIQWSDLVDEAQYLVTVYEADGTTEKCGEVVLTNNTTSHSSCSLSSSTIYKLKVVAQDNAGNVSGFNMFSFYVGINYPAKINTIDCFNSAYVSESYNCQVSGTGAEPIQSLTYDFTGTTCSWMVVDSNTGVVEGTPGGVDRGPCELQVKVSDGSSTSSTWKRSIYVYGGPEIGDVATGYNHSCVVNSNEVMCWGSNSYSQLGFSGPGNFNSPQQVSGLSNASQLSLGAYFSCARENSGAKCWGDNANGQLGDSTNSLRSTPVDVSGLNSGVVKIVTGSNFSCALKTNGDVKCWGDNTFGQLGNGNNTDSYTPISVSSLSNIIDIAAGVFHACAIKDNGSLYCWGKNGAGQLGVDSTDNKNTPQPVLGIDGVNQRTKLVSINGNHSDSNGSTCVVLENGESKCWGLNTNGQLAQGNTTNYGTGINQLSTLLNINWGTGRTAKGVFAGGFHNCAILDNDSVKCVGDNSQGQLGLENSVTYGDDETGDSLPAVNLGTGLTIKKLALGSRHSCAILDSAGSDALKCWGHNGFGQLGLGDFTFRGLNAGTMGDSLEFVNLSDFPSGYLAFVTSTTYDGNLGGLSGADSICVSRATAVGLPYPNDFIAILSTYNGGTGGISAGSRIPSNAGPIVNLNGEQVASTFLGLFGTGINITAKINYDEMINFVSGTSNVWTGTNTNGSSNNYTCEDWTNNLSVSGRTGSTNGTNAQVINSGSGATCSALKRIYCISTVSN